MADNSAWESISRLIARESIHLDSKDWDAWLDLYRSDCVYWVPAWRSDGTLVEDPYNELSLIFYDDRLGLESRVYRLRTGKVASYSPAVRTSHMNQLVEVATASEDVRARTHWVVNSTLEGRVVSYFGHSEYTFSGNGDDMKIGRKKTIVYNDLVHQVLDFYHI